MEFFGYCGYCDCPELCWLVSRVSWHPLLTHPSTAPHPFFLRFETPPNSLSRHTIFVLSYIRYFDMMSDRQLLFFLTHYRISVKQSTYTYLEYWHRGDGHGFTILVLWQFEREIRVFK
jgi:hypothetical protein